MEWILLPALLGLLPAFIAQNKGRSFVAWWLYGALLFIVALPHALIMKSDIQAVERQQASEGMKKCPFCAEMVKSEAKLCRYCGKEFPEKRPVTIIPCRHCGNSIKSDEQYCPFCKQTQ